VMAAMVLRSARAVDMSVFVVRAFARLRTVAGTHADLAAKLAELESRVTGHDADLSQVIAALRKLIQPPRKPRRQIGYSH